MCVESFSMKLKFEQRSTLYHFTLTFREMIPEVYERHWRGYSFLTLPPDVEIPRANGFGAYQGHLVSNEMTQGRFHGYL